MIRVFRRYRRSVLGLFVILAAVLLMTSFGVDLSHHEVQTHAIMVDEAKISHSDFAEARREMESRYRQMFGNNFEAFAKAVNLNVPQAVTDQLIAGALVKREADARGLRVGDQELRSAIDAQFPQGFNPETWDAFVRSSGMSPQQFKSRLSEDLVRQQFADAFADASLVSAREASARVAELGRTYTVTAAVIDPSSFRKSVTAPTEEAIASYYENNSSLFEVPARASYSYVAFRPNQFMDKVEVDPSDIELYYTEHEAKFQNPEEYKVRHIQFNFPKESDPQKMSEAKDRALKALERARAGEDFARLATQLTDDFSTKPLGGDVGWVRSGRFPDTFFDQLAKVKTGGVADLIETDYGYHVAKVEEYRDRALKPLDSVRGEIEQLLRVEQAPLYADTKAHDFFDSWSKGSVPLTEAALTAGLAAADTKGLLEESMDPESDLRGLTALVIEQEGVARQLIPLKDVNVVVEVREIKAPEIAPLNSVRTRIIESLSENEARKIAGEAAQRLSEEARSKKESLEALAKKAKMEIVKAEEISQAKPGQGIFADRDMLRAIFNVDSAGAPPSKVFTVAGKYVVWQVASVTTPKTITSEQIAKTRTEEMKRAGEELLSAYIARLKSNAKIDVDASILTQQSASM